MIPIQYSFPTAIHLGAGIRTHLPSILKQANCQSPLIVTDRNLAGLPWVNAFMQACYSEDIQVNLFSDFEGNPLESHVHKGTQAFQDNYADSLIALGGGAAMDVAKAIALMAYHPGRLFDYEDGLPDGRAIDQPIPFLVAIPTTAGTGSEVGRSSVISEDVSKRKRILFSPRLMPPVVLVDPELTIALPAHVTAATGMDALTHLLEAYLAKGFHPLCDGIALEGLRLVKHSLQACVEFARQKAPASEAHLQARSNMMNAALMGGVAFQKGLGVNHSCAHALSTVCDMHHGLANGIMLPFTMAFNLSAVPDRFDTLSVMVGAKSPENFIQWLKALKQAIGIPLTLSSAGINPAHLSDLVDCAVQDPCHQLNPKPVTRKDFQAIFTQAF